jgi:hypothetical protein
MMRSTGAVFVGFIVVVALSLGTDQALHSLGVYPPWGQPMYATGLNLLALSYRIVYAIIGSYIAARPTPMRHALILGVIGVVLSSLGAITAITVVDVGPAWYPIALVLTTMPCAWLGGALYRPR